MTRKISKIMWGTVLGLFLFSLIVTLAGGNGSIISYGAGYIVPFVFVIQIILWIVGRKQKTDD